MTATAHKNEIEALADVFSNCEPDEGERGLAGAVLASDWLRDRLALAFNEGVIAQRAATRAHGGDAGRIVTENPYHRTRPGLCP